MRYGSTIRALCAASLLVAPIACGTFVGTDDSANETGTAATSPTSPSLTPMIPSSTAAATTSSSPPPQNTAACNAQAATLLAVIEADNAQFGSQNGAPAVLAVQTAACGKQIIVADGDSAATGTVTPTTLHRVGNITKTFVSLVVLSLANENKLTLDDTLHQWEPALQVPKDTEITVRMLLNQTSGLADYMGSPEIASDQKSPRAPETLVGYAVEMGQQYNPGEKFYDSATNNTPLVELLHTYAFAKANLTSTFFAGGETVSGTLAHGYDNDGNDLTYSEAPSILWAAGAIVTSPSDMLDWMAGLYGGTVVDSTTLATLLDVPGVAVQNGTTYGLGVYEYAASSKVAESVGHDGWVAGYSAKGAYFPASKTTIVVMMDSDSVMPIGKIINDAAETLALN